MTLQKGVVALIQIARSSDVPDEIAPKPPETDTPDQHPDQHTGGRISIEAKIDRNKISENLSKLGLFPLGLKKVSKRYCQSEGHGLNCSRSYEQRDSNGRRVHQQSGLKLKKSSTTFFVA